MHRLFISCELPIAEDDMQMTLKFKVSGRSEHEWYLGRVLLPEDSAVSVATRRHTYVERGLGEDSQLLKDLILLYGVFPVEYYALGGYERQWI